MRHRAAAALRGRPAAAKSSAAYRRLRTALSDNPVVRLTSARAMAVMAATVCHVVNSRLRSGSGISVPAWCWKRAFRESAYASAVLTQGSASAVGVDAFARQELIASS